ncbi:hypothetical protein NQ317_006515 [Molorchus minor]|uniref:Uncharacterized protein n=1 Tax=Molorchus minor TaxID=1323400 RepID=A0ABQ9JLX9_9CUCU|nr:hypothetical protein NQ317_006515 [Molorchus minor]
MFSTEVGFNKADSGNLPEVDIFMIMDYFNKNKDYVSSENKRNKVAKLYPSDGTEGFAAWGGGFYHREKSLVRIASQDTIFYRRYIITFNFCVKGSCTLRTAPKDFRLRKVVPTVARREEYHRKRYIMTFNFRVKGSCTLRTAPKDLRLREVGFTIKRSLWSEFHLKTEFFCGSILPFTQRKTRCPIVTTICCPGHPSLRHAKRSIVNLFKVVLFYNIVLGELEPLMWHEHWINLKTASANFIQVKGIDCDYS